MMPSPFDQMFSSIRANPKQTLQNPMSILMNVLPGMRKGGAEEAVPMGQPQMPFPGRISGRASMFNYRPRKIYGSDGMERPTMPQAMPRPMGLLGDWGR